MYQWHVCTKSVIWKWNYQIYIVICVGTQVSSPFIASFVFEKLIKVMALHVQMIVIVLQLCFMATQVSITIPTYVQPLLPSTQPSGSTTIIPTLSPVLYRLIAQHLETNVCLQTYAILVLSSLILMLVQLWYAHVIVL